MVTQLVSLELDLSEVPRQRCITFSINVYESNDNITFVNKCNFTFFE